jgi:histidine ammonia-lyase
MSKYEVVVGARPLSLNEIESVARHGHSVRLASDARDAVSATRAFLEGMVADGQTIYGVNTGFGRLADVAIPPEDLGALQRNLVRSHASGVGRPMAEELVRSIMLLRANALAVGHSGCRPEIIELLLAMLNARIHPVVPEVGSVGASGDLAPLAHIALGLIGEGEVDHQGERKATTDALAAEGLVPVELVSKEGLALINGTQATTSHGLLALLGAERAVATAEVCGAMSLEALRGTPEAFRSEVHEARPHRGQLRSAACLRHLLRDSEIRESHRHNDPRVQDAYALRCMPQVHGAAHQALSYVREVIEVEANSVTDNPLFFPEAGVVVSAGNFHAQIVSQALDFMVIAMTDLAAISERRIERLLNPDLSGLPAFLARSPGLESGFMIAQVTAVDLLAEMRILSHPASVDSVPTSASQEDHVSMGLASARKVRRALECLQYVLAIELMIAAEAVEYHRPLSAGAGVEDALARVRERVEPLTVDRSITSDLESLKAFIHGGGLADLVPASTGAV